MAADDRTGSGPAWPGDNAGPGEGSPQGSPQGPEPPQPGFGQPGYPPQPGYGQPPAYPQPGFGQPPAYPPQPGYGPPWGAPGPGFVPPLGTPTQPGGWPVAPYPPTGWGYPPGFGFAPFVPAGPAPGLSWGGIGVRFGALMIDAVLMVVAFVIAMVLAEAAGVRHYAGDYVTYSSAATAIYWIWVLFFVCYHPACWWVFGGSAGQRALGLRVVRASDGLKLGLGAVLIRYFVFAVSTGTVILGIIAAAMANDDPFKRAWHDEAARSVVVRRA